MYLKQLEYSRNYSKYIKDYEEGKNREDVFPEEIEKIPKKSESLVNKKAEPDSKDSSALIRQLIKPKPNPKNSKKSSLKGQGLLQKQVIWCARCSKNHPIDYHAQKVQKKPIISLPVKRVHQLSQRKPEEPEEFSDELEEEEDQYESEEDSFIVDDDEDYETVSKVSKMVRSITGFDPKKYQAIDRLSTKGMESSASQILNEERYTAKIGQMEDQRELELQMKKKRKV